MTRLTVESSVGDALDRISILQIKVARVPEPKRRKNVEAELSALLSAWMGGGLPAPEEVPEYTALRTVNEALWAVEDELRSHEARQDFGELFVSLARSVYHQNDQRAALKRRVNTRYGSALREEKVHPSYAGGSHD